MATKVLTHLMFDGDAEEAMNFYVGLLPNSRVVSIQRYEEGDNKGKVLQARFELNAREFVCIDTPIKHNFSFTPSMSIFVEFESKPDFEQSFERLSMDGSVMMPADNYGFSELFAWVTDRFGVSWQLNLEA